VRRVRKTASASVGKDVIASANVIPGDEVLLGRTFVPTGAYYVRYACAGTGTIDFATSDGARNWVSQNCANGAVRAQVGAKPTSGGVINLAVEAAPKTLWEVVIYELAAPRT
jgi:hypothetical protein